MLSVIPIEKKDVQKTPFIHIIGGFSTWSTATTTSLKSFAFVFFGCWLFAIQLHLFYSIQSNFGCIYVLYVCATIKSVTQKQQRKPHTNTSTTISFNQYNHKNSNTNPNTNTIALTNTRTHTHMHTRTHKTNMLSADVEKDQIFFHGFLHSNIPLSDSMCLPVCSYHLYVILSECMCVCLFHKRAEKHFHAIL